MFTADLVQEAGQLFRPYYTSVLTIAFYNKMIPFEYLEKHTNEKLKIKLSDYKLEEINFKKKLNIFQ